MLKNYLTITIRNLFKNKLYTGINILGLTIGMTCFILIALYIQYEMSFDQHHSKADRIYRLVQKQKGNAFRGKEEFNVAPLPLAGALIEEFPEVENATTVQFLGNLLNYEEKTFFERGLFADEFAFDIFDVSVKEGIGKEALKDPNSILLTESLAQKYFGEESPIGRTMLFNNEKLLAVKGVIEDVPENQHFTYDYVVALQNCDFYEEDLGPSWGSNNYKAYVLLKDGYNYKDLEAKLSFFDKYTEPAYQNVPFQPEIFLQPIKDIHLFSDVNFETGANNDINNIYFFAGLGLIILLLASINYMNLTTARSAGRSKEVGVRKVLGAFKKQLIFQLLSESFILTLISFILALILTTAVLPAYNQLFDQQIPFSLFGSSGLMILMLLIAILVGGLSGLYPAIFLSLVSPTQAFRESILKSKGGIGLRNILVIGQFAVAIGLGIVSICIYQQLQYIQNKKLGYNRDQVVYIPFGQDEIVNKKNTIKIELLKHSGIDKVSFAVNLPLNTGNQGIVDEWEGNETKEELWIYRNYTDKDYLDLFEMELVEGRYFSPQFSSDSMAYILNESAVKAIGWESAVGKNFRGGKVIGVVKDFHFQPFDLKIEPQFIGNIEGQGYYGFANIAIKVNMEDSKNAIAHIEGTMKNMFPQFPLEPLFMDEQYNRLYESERRFGQAYTLFTALALFIACMGLFGLVSHHVLQRNKEIGIRKVLGATTYSIVTLLSKDFVKLVTIALVIAIPVAWYVANQWLQDFAYRIQIRWWVFVIASIMAILVALITVSFQSVKAALANPVESIRQE